MDEKDVRGFIKRDDFEQLSVLILKARSKQLFLSSYTKKENDFYPLNQLQSVTVVFFTIINKFSDTGRKKVNLVAFLEKLKSLVAFLAKHSLSNPVPWVDSSFLLK